MALALLPAKISGYKKTRPSQAGDFWMSWKNQD
jgi:hypothetical protein